MRMSAVHVPTCIFIHGSDLSRSNSAVLDIGPYLEEWSQTLVWVPCGYVQSLTYE
jgi:hypothetical protein